MAAIVITRSDSGSASRTGGCEQHWSHDVCCRTNLIFDNVLNKLTEASTVNKDGFMKQSVIGRVFVSVSSRQEKNTKVSVSKFVSKGLKYMTHLFLTQHMTTAS